MRTANLQAFLETSSWPIWLTSFWFWNWVRMKDAFLICSFRLFSHIYHRCGFNMESCDDYSQIAYWSPFCLFHYVCILGILQYLLLYQPPQLVINTLYLIIIPVDEVVNLTRLIHKLGRRCRAGLGTCLLCINPYQGPLPLTYIELEVGVLYIRYK